MSFHTAELSVFIREEKIKPKTPELKVNLTDIRPERQTGERDSAADTQRENEQLSKLAEGKDR